MTETKQKFEIYSNLYVENLKLENIQFVQIIILKL